MTRLEEIEARMAQIKVELDDPEADLDALESEVRSLTDERKAILDAAEARQKKLDDIARGIGVVEERNIITKENKIMERTFAVDTAEYRDAWLKNLQGKALDAEERAAITASAAIPQITANKIKGKMELYPLLNAVDVMYLPGTVVIPVEGTVNDASIVAMGSAATDSADTLASISLNTYKIIKTIEITADVQAMAIDAFEGWLVDRLANKIYRFVTKMVAAGTGSSQPTGLTSVASSKTYTKAAITYSDIMNIIADLKSEYAPNAAFVMSRATFFGNVLKIMDNSNDPIVVKDVQAPAKYNILGYPVIIEDEVGTDIIFGDLKEGYVFNFGAGVSVARDESVGFRTGSTVYRAMCLGDGKPTGVGLVRYTKAAS